MITKEDKKVIEFIKQSVKTLEYCLAVFNETCDCGQCGPCKSLYQMEKLIGRGKDIVK